jgi:hypothetical protein
MRSASALSLIESRSTFLELITTYHQLYFRNTFRQNCVELRFVILLMARQDIFSLLPTVIGG